MLGLQYNNVFIVLYYNENIYFCNNKKLNYFHSETTYLHICVPDEENKKGRGSVHINQSTEATSSF